MILVSLYLVAVPHDQQAGELIPTETDQLPLESLPVVTAAAGGQIGNGLALYRKMILKPTYRVVTRRQGAGRRGQVLKDQRGLLPGVDNEDWLWCGLAHGSNLELRIIVALLLGVLGN